MTTVGQITTRYSSRTDDKGNELLRLEVADTGPGVPDANKELIFQPFMQVCTCVRGGKGGGRGGGG